MSKTLDCEFKCGSILPPCVFDQLWEPLFSSSHLSLAKWEKNVTAVNEWSHWSPALIVMVWESQKTKVKFVSEIPLPVVLFVWHSQLTLPLHLGPVPSEGLGPTLVQREAKRWWAWELRPYVANVSETSTSRWASALYHPVARLPRARCLWTPKEKAAPGFWESPVTIALLKGFAFLSSPQAVDGIGAEGFSWKKWLCELWRHASPRGRECKGRLPPLWVSRLSICSLWRRRQSALRLFNSFPYFFNIEKIIFKNCDFKKIIWLEGREKGNTKSCNMVNWRYLTGGTF